jgi:hypothetical protein
METILIFSCLAALYVALKIVLEDRLASLDTIDIDGDLADAAFICGCSVYDPFHRSGQPWRFSQAKIESDFKTYLNGSQAGHDDDLA